MRGNRTSPPNKIAYEAGQKIGACIYLGQEYSKNWRRYALFECECGEKFYSQIQKVKSGHTETCGCLRIATVVNMNTTHGMSDTEEYHIWVNMNQRCENPNNDRYADWGGRGIVVCERWKDSFENFFADMGKRPSSKHELDRIENDGNYEPNNCGWVTKKQQSLNRRSNLLIEYNGVIKPLRSWTDELNIPYTKTWLRLKRLNWSPKEAFESQ